MAVVRFESREAAAANSARPEQGAWWQKMQECFEGEVTFHDCDDVTMFLGGGSDDAGFVQIIQGRLDDADRFREFMSQPMDTLHEARPEILGGTIAIEPDGTFTQTWRSPPRPRPERASQGDARGHVRASRARCSVMEDVTYLDLRHPWFASRTGAATG